MKKLGNRNYTLISMGVNTCGTFNPDEILGIFEEELYADEVNEIYKFLQWVHKNNLRFGRGNYEEMFTRFKNS